jgi:TPR repeat protein
MEKSLFDEGSAAYESGDYETAFALFLRSAQGGDVDSMTRVASMYGAGEGANLDFQKSIEWDEKAVEAGSIASISNLGITYRMCGDTRKARFWFEKAIAAGDCEAALDLAKMYLISDLETARIKKYLELVLSGENSSVAAREEAAEILLSFSSP